MLLRSCCHSMSMMKKTNITAIIIDDEPLARVNIRSALSALPNWQVVLELESGKHLISALKNLKPDVVFLDIRMPGDDGITLASEMLQLQHCPLIIFVTAFDDYAIQAFELFALDYVLKPFDDDRFQKTVQRASQSLERGQQHIQISEWQKHIKGNNQPLNKLLIRSVGSLRIIPVDEVLWLAASGNYVEVHHLDGMHLHRVPLSVLVDKLDPAEFCRVHRSAVVRLSAVRELRTPSDDKYFAILTNGAQVRVSSGYRELLLEQIASQ